MEQVFHEIKINTKGQGLYDFTSKTVSWINEQEILNGLLNIKTDRTFEFSLELKHDVKLLLALWAFLILASISESESLKAIVTTPYQLDLTTPGNAPDIESSLIFILDNPNFL